MTRGRPSRACDATRPRNRERGAAAVEFALVVPVLVLILCGIIGFGFLFAQQLALGNAARQAARSAAVASTYCGTGQGAGSAGTQLTGQAKVNATTVGVTSNNVVVALKRSTSTPTDWTSGTCTGDTTQACAGSTAGDIVYARVSYTSTLNMPFFTPSFDLAAIGAFRCEFQ